MKYPRISDAEWHVMNVVWANAPTSAGEVVEALASQQGWHSRTTRTLLARLVKKRALKIRLDGKRYLYEPLVSREESQRQESQSLLQRVFGGEQASMLLRLVGEARLSKDEIQQLKDILSRKEK